MIECAVYRSPTRIRPFACSTAIRAEQPVPVGERSTLPGRIATALDPVSTPSSSVRGRAHHESNEAPSRTFGAMRSVETAGLPRALSSSSRAGRLEQRHRSPIVQGVGAAILQMPVELMSGEGLGLQAPVLQLRCGLGILR